MAQNNETPASLPANEPVAFDDRIRRVMELKKQIREGTYRIDDEAIAKAILGEWISVGDIVIHDDVTPVVETAAERKAVGARFVVAKDSPETESTSAVVRIA